MRKRVVRVKGDRWWRNNPCIEKPEVNRLQSRKYKFLDKCYEYSSKVPDFGFGPSCINDLIDILCHGCFGSTGSTNAMEALIQILEKKKGKYFSLHNFRKLFSLYNELNGSKGFEKDCEHLISQVGGVFKGEFVDSTNNYFLDKKIPASKKIIAVRCLRKGIKDLVRNDENLRIAVTLLVENWLTQEIFTNSLQFEVTRKLLCEILILIEDFDAWDDTGEFENILLGYEVSPRSNNKENALAEISYEKKFEMIRGTVGAVFGDDDIMKELCPHCEFERDIVHCIHSSDIGKWRYCRKTLIPTIYDGAVWEKKYAEKMFALDVYISLGNAVSCWDLPSVLYIRGIDIDLPSKVSNMKKKRSEVLKFTFFDDLRENDSAIRTRLLKEFDILNRYGSLIGPNPLYEEMRIILEGEKKIRTILDGNAIKFKVSSEMTLVCRIPYSSVLKLSLTSPPPNVDPRARFKNRDDEEGDDDFRKVFQDYHFWGFQSYSMISSCFGVPLIDVNPKNFIHSYSRLHCHVVRFSKQKSSVSTKPLQGKRRKSYDSRTISLYEAPSLLSINLNNCEFMEIFNHSFLSIVEYKGTEYLVCSETVLFTITLIDIEKAWEKKDDETSGCESEHGESECEDETFWQKKLEEKRKSLNGIIFRGHDWEVFGVGICEELDLLVSCDGISIRIWDFDTRKQLYHIFNVPLCSKLVVYNEKIYVGFQNTGVKEYSIPRDIREMSKREPLVDISRVNEELKVQSMCLVQWFSDNQRIFYNKHYFDEDDKPHFNQTFRFRILDFQVTRDFVFVLGEEIHCNDFKKEESTTPSKVSKEIERVTNRKDSVRNRIIVKVFSRTSEDLLATFSVDDQDSIRIAGSNQIHLNKKLFNRIDAFKHFFVVSIYNKVSLYDIYGSRKKKKSVVLQEWKFKLLKSRSSSPESTTRERGIMMLKIVPLSNMEKKKNHEFYIYAATNRRLFRVFFSYWKRCKKCSKVSRKLKRCSRCSITFYCSRKCQSKDWKRHKYFCR